MKIMAYRKDCIYKVNVRFQKTCEMYPQKITKSNRMK